jgi:hypothetical protein
MVSLLKGSEWIAPISGIVGLIVGAFISEFRIVLADARERRRALNVLLFDLLELRNDVRTSNPRLLIDTLQRILRRKFPGVDITAFLGQLLQPIIASIHKEVMGNSRLRLTERYEGALHTLVPYDPMLAYRLAGSERLAAVERAIALYYDKIAQHPGVANDPNAPRFLSVIQDETTTALIDEVLKNLADDLRRIARARRWWLFRWLWMPLAVQRALRRQGHGVTRTQEQELEAMIDRVIPLMEAALNDAARHMEPHQ